MCPNSSRQQAHHGRFEGFVKLAGARTLTKALVFFWHLGGAKAHCSALYMDLKLPNLGEGADSGTVVTLFVKEGDKLAKDQPVLELENEKAVATIPSTADGTVTKVYVKAGDRISVGQKILSLGEGAAGAEAPASQSKPAAKTKAAPEKRSIEQESEAESDEAVEEDSGETNDEPAATKLGVPPAASPSLRKMAAELGIDLHRVKGSERGGRIVLADVRAYIQKLQKLASKPVATGTAAGSAPAKAQPAEQIDFAKWGSVTKKALSPLRQVIARRMTENWNAIPHVTQFDDADITELMALRKKYADAYEKKGARLTVTSFSLKLSRRH